MFLTVPSTFIDPEKKLLHVSMEVERSNVLHSSEIISDVSATVTPFPFNFATVFAGISPTVTFSSRLQYV